MHEFFSRLSDYDIKKTNYQINNILKNWIEKGRKTWLCKTLRYKGVIPANRCQRCEWTGHGQDPLVALKVLIKKNPKEINKPEHLKALADLKLSDAIEFGIVFDSLGLKGTTKTAVKEAIEKIISEKRESEKLQKPELQTPEKIARIGNNIMRRGNVVKFLTLQAQRNHKGDTEVIKPLLASIASTNSETSAGIQPAISGDKG
ncbi:MAG: hypothetical protein MUO26_06595 [Methanotrichaceae archaeon]|nr:hypothetical protein [Methanotrichaceae archaeon]